MFFYQWILLFPQESCPKSRVDQTSRATCTHKSKTNFLCLLQMLLCLCCWGITSTSPFMSGSSQTSTISSNFCGHVNVTESMKPIQSKAQVLMAWIHIGWTVNGKVVKMWKVFFWRLHSSEIDIKAILQIKSAMWSAMACPFFYESKRRLY